MRALLFGGLAAVILAAGCGCPTHKEPVREQETTASLHYQADGVVRDLPGVGGVSWSPGGPTDRAGTMIAPPSVGLTLAFGDRAFSVLVYVTVNDIGLGPSETDFDDTRAVATAGSFGPPYHGITGHLSIASLATVCDGEVCVMRGRGTFTLSATGAAGEQVEVTGGTFSIHDRIIDVPVCPES